MPSLFKNIKSPTPIEQIDIYEFIDTVKSPDSYTKSKILKARELKLHGKEQEYNRVKSSIPCYTLNFSFTNRKSNKNIDKATGVIYIDVDNETNIDLSNPLIFASWHSLSGKGRGVLVKVNGLSISNFKDTYKDISKKLGIKSDIRASKATQYTVLSYDPNIYVNNNSTTWEVEKEFKNTPNTVTYLKKEKKVTTEMGGKYEVKYDNLEEIDFNGEDYIVFPDEKGMTAKAWIPPIIKIGERNEVLSTLTYQLRALNIEMEFESFRQFIHNINLSRCEEPLPDYEVDKIVWKIEKTDILQPLLNAPRRVVFNPKSNLTPKEKRAITNKITGANRTKKTIEKLKEFVENWDYKFLGKITQKKLTKETGMNKKTIEKYYKHVKEKAIEVNTLILKNKASFLIPFLLNIL